MGQLSFRTWRTMRICQSTISNSEKTLAIKFTRARSCSRIHCCCNRVLGVLVRVDLCVCVCTYLEQAISNIVNINLLFCRRSVSKDHAPLVLAITGPTGTGKTETANLIAEGLFKRRKKLQHSDKQVATGLLIFRYIFCDIYCIFILSNIDFSAIYQRRRFQ